MPHKEYGDNPTLGIRLRLRSSYIGSSALLLTFITRFSDVFWGTYLQLDIIVVVLKVMQHERSIPLNIVIIWVQSCHPRSLLSEVKWIEWTKWVSHFWHVTRYVLRSSSHDHRKVIIIWPQKGHHHMTTESSSSWNNRKVIITWPQKGHYHKTIERSSSHDHRNVIIIEQQKGHHHMTTARSLSQDHRKVIITWPQKCHHHMTTKRSSSQDQRQVIIMGQQKGHQCWYVRS